jgi:DNA-binding transcriptional ArsR family regulator
VNEPAGDPFEALGDPHRREIVELLRGGGRSVGDIAQALPISRPAVSRHLRLLKHAGLVTEQPQGTRRIYQLDVHGIDTVENYIAQVWGDAVTRFRLMAENTVPSSNDDGGGDTQANQISVPPSKRTDSRPRSGRQ